MIKKEKSARQHDFSQKEEKIRAEERGRILRLIDPHFIFNTLGAIRIATKTNADLAYHMIYDFTKYFRAVLGFLISDGNILFREEAACVLCYVDLEKIRFGENIVFHMEIGEENFMLPPLSVQPLVENAIRHGIIKGRGKGTVTLRSYQTVSEYIVQVEDDGTGFEAGGYNKMPGDDGPQAHSLQRIRYRVEKMTAGSMEVKSYIGVGTIVTLHIPKRGQEAAEK
ncbi:MAG: histidine kinase [Ruminococcus sp.]|nr:histidine kinase [Ruminococcus sp.]